MTRFRIGMRWLLGVFFILAGVNHFLSRQTYMAIMPPYLPWHEELIAISGVAEVVLGGLVLLPRIARVAGLGIVILLVAIFPANIHMAVHSELYPRIAPPLLWIRLPLQGLLILWANWCSKPRVSP